MRISTSYIERQNLTMRMSMRRFTRLTSGFSKKIENMKAAVSLHFAHYNLVRMHKTLKCTPAMAAANERIETIKTPLREILHPKPSPVKRRDIVGLRRHRAFTGDRGSGVTIRASDPSVAM